MNKHHLSRRAFLRSASDAARGSAIVLTLPMIITACSRANDARLSGESFQNLTEEEALAFDAIAARIIPTDETPGATEAGVIYFIDNILASGWDEQRLILQDGLRELQIAVGLSFGAAYFHELEAQQQDQLLTEIENTPFFSTIRYLTVAGMFSLPEYGGNRDSIGFDLIGFEDRHAWQPPYGFYDADYAERGE
ncbi:MAG: hypothetical protein COA96_08960 [SAR86 cluster bacterium]|uniref:Twin-arginine translocation pathway signal n=1 Tax=SAR86 cluster bacterium TaxID=2030880 RepID=A0A2A5AZC8_9GAMM|nr:MAG: hypothetical protein COA96_08960 [SAR86 cluster bacterium]